MSSLRIKQSGKLISELILDESKVYLAGRKEGADIFIEAAKAISREHFTLKFDGHWKVEVISRFGDLLFQNSKVREINLLDDCVFSIFPYEFEFLKDGVRALSAPASSQTENSQISPLEGEFDKTQVGKIEYVPSIIFVDENQNPQSNIQLGHSTEWTAGRDSTCEVQINDQRVSRKQFKIIKDGNQFFIQALGSVNGTFVNSKQLESNQKIPLKSSDRIQVLDSLMLFELKNARFEDELKALSNINSQFPDRQNSMIAHTSATQNSMVNFTSEMAPMPMNQGLTGVTHPQSMSPYVDPNVLNYNYQSPPMIEDEDDYEEEENEKKKKIRFLLVAGVILVFMFVGYNEFLAPAPKATKVKSTDPFSALAPNEFSLLKQSFEIANDYYLKSNHQLAYDETAKIIKKLEDSGIKYQKTKFGMELLDLHSKAQTAILAVEELKKHELRLKQEAESRARLELVIAHCSRRLKAKPKMTELEYNECAREATDIDPNDVRIQDARLLIAQRVDLENMRKKEQEAFRAGVAKLKGLYDRATATERRGELLQAIEDYKIVVNQSLPDPQELKEVAQRRIASIKKSIGTKSARFLDEANRLSEQKKYKEAIEQIRKAQKVNPLDSDLEDRVQLLKRSLAKEIKPIWDESVIEEDYNQVECLENKSCAIEKWKKILEMDVRDGEYYLKAFTKLKKYGAN